MTVKEFFCGIFKPGAQDLTTGSIPLLLTRFAIPYMIANLLQALYGAADMIIVGQFTDAVGVSAVALGSQFIFMINSFVIGLSIGGTILIARACGAGNAKDADDIISTMLTLFMIISAISTAVLLIFIDPIVRLLGTPSEAFSATRSYVYINSAGITTMIAYNAIAAVFRGFGDSTSPLIFVAIACALNVVLDLLLVGPMGMGASGAAIATITAQGLSALLALLYSKRAGYNIDLRPRALRIKTHALGRLMHVGLPMACQFSLSGISFIFITATLAGMAGVAGASAAGITGKINGFTMLPPTSFAGAIAAMVAQNIGAVKYDRARGTVISGLVICVVIGLLTFAGLFFFPAPVIRIFTRDPNLIASTAMYIRSFSIDCVLVSFLFCFNGFFNGCGKTPFTMANNLFSAFAIRVPATWLLSRIAGASLFTVGFAAPIATVQGILFSVIYLKSGRWKRE